MTDTTASRRTFHRRSDRISTHRRLLATDKPKEVIRLQQAKAILKQLMVATVIVLGLLTAAVIALVLASIATLFGGEEVFVKALTLMATLALWGLALVALGYKEGKYWPLTFILVGGSIVLLAAVHGV